tara:strand:+ start:977 stop:1471 length:495 start_codon:yes stop_codon:yes gene_type:complete
MAGVSGTDDLNMKSALTWNRFSKLIMAEILEKIPQLKKEEVISQLEKIKNQSYLLTYRFKPLGKDRQNIIAIIGALDQTGIWDKGSFDSIFFVFEEKPQLQHPWSHPNKLGEALDSFDKNHFGTEFQSIEVKGYGHNNTDKDEGAGPALYITCTPDGYLFRTLK